MSNYSNRVVDVCWVSPEGTLDWPESVGLTRLENAVVIENKHSKEPCGLFINGDVVYCSVILDKEVYKAKQREWAELAIKSLELEVEDLTQRVVKLVAKKQTLAADIGD